MCKKTCSAATCGIRDIRACLCWCDRAGHWKLPIDPIKTEKVIEKIKYIRNHSKNDIGRISGWCAANRPALINPDGTMKPIRKIRCCIGKYTINWLPETSST